MSGRGLLLGTVAGRTMPPGSPARPFALAEDLATDTVGILAIKGSGKTYAALVLAEELVRAGVPTLILDPVGVAWGLRLSPDGKAPGLPVLVLGGEHGDAPLEPHAGRAMADAVAQRGDGSMRAHVVLDLSGFGTKADHLRFARELLEQLYQVNREPLHVILDEADELAPQRPFGEEARVLRSVEVLVRRGRARGLGATLITQRAAVLSKNVLTQCSTLILGRTSSPQDRAAVEAWIEAHSTVEERDRVMESLAALPTADKWVWSPNRGLLERVTIRARETFDSSATPTVGARRATAPLPGAMYRESLTALRDHIVAMMAASAPPAVKGKRASAAAVSSPAADAPPPPSTGDETAAEHVRELEARVRELEARLARSYEHVRTLAAAIASATAALSTVSDSAPVVGASSARNGARPLPSAFPTGARAAPSGWPTVVVDHEGTAGRSPIVVASPNGAPFATRVPAGATPIVGDLEPGQVRILAVLAQYPAGRSRAQLAILARFALRGGAFGTHLRRLVAGGWALDDGGRYTLSEKGRAAAPDVEPLPVGRALLDLWLATLPKPQQRILGELADVYPRKLKPAAVAARLAMSERGGAFGGHVRQLRTLELIAGRRELVASAVFFEGAPS